MDYDDYYDKYIGKRLKENFMEVAGPILEKGKADFDVVEDYEIKVILLDREFEECDETFSLSCHLIIELDEGEITSIYHDDRVWGGDGLGDVDPGDICSSEELERMDNTEEELLKAIVE